MFHIPGKLYDFIVMFFYLLQAVTLSINPLYLMIPATMSASYAFMLPVATPPNAIAFSFGYLKVYDMVSILLNSLYADMEVDCLRDEYIVYDDNLGKF